MVLFFSRKKVLKKKKRHLIYDIETFVIMVSERLLFRTSSSVNEERRMEIVEGIFSYFSSICPFPGKVVGASLTSEKMLSKI